MILFASTYTTIVQPQPVIKERWWQEADETLQGCFEPPDRDTVSDPPPQNICTMTECDENTILTRTIRCFLNNKPCITNDQKDLPSKRKRASSESNQSLKPNGDRAERHTRESSRASFNSGCEMWGHWRKVVIEDHQLQGEEGSNW